MHKTIRAALICGLAGLTPFQSFAQSSQYQVHIGDKHRDKVHPLTPLGSDNDGNVYAFGMRAKLQYLIPLVFVWSYRVGIHPYVKKYDKDMNFLADYPLRGENGVASNLADGHIGVTTAMMFGTFSVYNATPHSFRWGNNAYIATPNLTKQNFYLVRLGLDGTMQEAQPMLTASKQSLTDKVLKSTEVESKFSPDSSYVAFIFKSKSGKKQSAYASVFDRSMKRQWTTSFSLPAGRGKGKIDQQIAVSNSGQIYILTVQDARKDDPGSATLLQLDGQKGRKPLPMRFNNAGLYISDVKLTLTNENKPAIVGFYRDSKRRMTGHDGLVYGMPDGDGNFIVSRKQPFDLAMVSSIFTEKEKKKAERKVRRGKDISEDPDFHFLDFFPTADGGAIAIAEEQYLVVSSHTSGTGNNTRIVTDYIYHYGDIMMVKVGSDFHIEWVRKAAKHNSFTQPIDIQPYVKNYSPVMMDNKVYVLFNDVKGLEGNVHSRKQRNQYDGSASTYIVSISSEGTLDRDEAVRSADIHGYSINLSRGIYTEGGKIYFIATPNGPFKVFSKKTRLGSITLPAKQNALSMQ
jgi:hypothetical protein